MGSSERLGLQQLYTFSDPFVSAASGLALVEDHFYVVADDELFALKLHRNFNFAQSITLFPGELSLDKKLRKRIKPDLESIVALPSGEILCVPSGSETHRVRGALIKGESVREISFESLYGVLRGMFTELNIEGAVVVGESLRLFQRGNGAKRENATVDVNLKDFLHGSLSMSQPRRYKLGGIEGAALSFTDATQFQDRIYFLAAAEACESTYLDGEFRGAVLGVMDLSGTILGHKALDIPSKPEGLVVEGERFYVVTDDDDRSKPSRLLSGSLIFN